MLDLISLLQFMAAQADAVDVGAQVSEGGLYGIISVLGLTTVAEGVETEEVLQIVKELGCDEFQGFLASKPLSAEEITPILMHGHFHVSGTSDAMAQPWGLGTLTTETMTAGTTDTAATSAHVVGLGVDDSDMQQPRATAQPEVANK